MNKIEEEIQKQAVIQVQLIFQTRFKKYLVLIQDSKGNIQAKSPLFAVPNGGYRPAGVGKQLKESGTKSGIADLILPLHNKRYAQLWIEVKEPKKGKQSPNQKQWESFCKQTDIKYVICKSTQEIIDTVLKYMESVTCG